MVVGTRNSLPGAEDGTPPVEGRRAVNALKKLAINGKPTLMGEKRPDADHGVTVYHHRGGSYAVTDKTPQSWLENQPARYKRRKSYAGLDGSDEGDDDDEAPRPPIRKRARVVSFGEEDEEAYRPPPPKRTRRSAPERFSEIHVDEDDAVGEDAPRRARRNLPDVYYGRPKRQPGDPTQSTPRKRRKPRVEEESPITSSRLYDYAVVGGREEMSCQEAKRRRAIMMGLEVRPIENKFDMNSLENRAARELGAHLMKLARVNTKLDRLFDNYEEVNAKIEALKERRRQRDAEQAEKAADEVNEEIMRAGIASEPPGDFNEQPVEAPRARSASPRAVHQPQSIQAPTPPSNDAKEVDEAITGAEQEEIDSGIEIAPPRHDSATALTEASLAQIPTNDSAAELTLPETNKAGNRLRWSLPANIQNPERAEASILRQRMDGESRSAKRRRVRRELNVIKTWADKTDTASSISAPREQRAFASPGQKGDGFSPYYCD